MKGVLEDPRQQQNHSDNYEHWSFQSLPILAPALFADAPAGAFSLTRLFDQAGGKGRLFGLRLEGVWMHVGTPQAVAEAEAALAETN